MLARSYATMDRHDQAAGAYAKAIELAPQDAALMADYADSLAVQQGRKLTGTPMTWVRRALKADPAQPKALLLAGTEAFQRQAYPEAIGHWEKVVQGGQASPGLLQQAQAGLADARQAAGLPPVDATPLASPATNVGTPATAGAQVSGRVTLSPALAAQAKPDDTVFVVARPAQGPRMPLAVLRRQVKDLPLDFVLDDSLAMSPAARLSGASTVVVSARISRSGQAMPQPGDLEGVSPAVPVGRTGLALEIRDAVK
jgi:cytochrome c-type biogenesis protein CcmH